MKKRRSLLGKVFVSTVSVISILFMLLSGVFSYWNHDRMVKEYRQVLHAYATNAASTFSIYMETVHSFAERLYSSRLGVSTRFEEVYHVGDTVELLIDLRGQMEPYYQSVFILNNKGNVTFHAGNGVSYPVQLGQQIEALAKKQNMGMEPVVWKAKNRNYREADIPLCSFFWQEAKVGESYYAGSVVINLDMNALSEQLFANTEKENFEACIIDKNGKVVAHSNNQHLGEDWSDRAYIQDILAGKEGSELQKVKDKNLEVVGFEIGRDGFCIVVQSFNSVTGTGQLVPIIILGIAFLLSIVMIYVFSRRLFEPFDSLTMDIRNEMEAEYGIEKIYDDVGFLTQYHALTSQYIDNLHVQEYKNFAMKSLLQGTWNQEMEEFIAERKIVAAQKKYCIAIVQISSEEDLVGKTISICAKQREIVEEACRKTIEKKYKFVGMELGLRKLLLVVCDEYDRDLERNYIAQCLEDASKKLKKNEKLDILFAISDCEIHQQVYFEELFKQVQKRMESMLEEDKGEHADNQKSENNKSYSNPELIERVIDYINNNYFDNEINVSIIARRFHINHSYLGRLFLEYAGQNMNEYLMDVRMKRAHDLLMTNSDISIAQVSKDVGFNSSTYFATCFRKYYGISPSKIWEFGVNEYNN